MAENDEEKGFSVKDKRLFTEEGEVRPEAPEEDRGEEKTEGTGERIEGMEKPDEGPKQDLPPLPEINFPSFILSLHTSALFHFGDLQDPALGETRKDLGAAKQTIDILSMLWEKTAGNLNDDEKKLLDEILFDLRMRFIRETEKK